MRRLRTIALVVVGACAFAALGYGAALTMAPAADGDHSRAFSPVTADVELRRIRSVVNVRGDAGFTDPVQVQVNVVAPIPVVTRTPARVGDAVEGGDVLVEVAGRPVILLPGQLPAYRDLKVGDLGPDVEQLELALLTLGLSPGEVDDTFDKRTEAAIVDLYEDLDYEPPVTGVPMSELAFVADLPRRLDSQPARVGVALPPQPILLSGTRLVISVGLTASDAAVLRAGMKAVIDLPDGTRVTGRLGSVRTTATGGATTVRIPVLGSKARRALRGANVKVTVPLESTKKRVRVVPLAALSTDARGTVRVVRVEDDGSTAEVQVKVGLSANGYAEVSAPTGELTKGDHVVVGE